MTTPDPFKPLLRPARIFSIGTDPFFPFPDRQTQDFLEDNYDLSDTIKLWDTSSGYAGMLEARNRPVNLNKKKAESKGGFTEEVIAAFVWLAFFDFNIGRYRYLKNGRFISAEQIKLGNLRVAKAQEMYMSDLTQQLIDGQITERQWYLSMRKAMKDEYRAAWIASIGGVENYNRSEASKFGWAVRPQYRWLDNFLLEIQSGKQPLNAFAKRRARMYARAANGIYQNNIFKIAQRNGLREAKRNLGESEQHCHDSKQRPGCIELAQLGYVPMEQATPIGSATCLSHCLCSWSFR